MKENNQIEKPIDKKKNLYISINEFLKNVPVKKLLYIAIIIVIWQLGAWSFRHVAGKLAQNVLEPRTSSNSLIKASVGQFSVLKKQELIKLERLIKLLENSKEEKKQIFIELYKYQYSSATLLNIFATITGIMILILSKTGMQHVSNFFKISLYLFLALTTFHGVSAILYKKEYNIHKNRTAYIEYDNLQMDIYNYAQTGLLNDSTIDIKSFHTKIVQGIKRLNTIDFEMDEKAVDATKVTGVSLSDPK